MTSTFNFFNNNDPKMLSYLPKTIDYKSQKRNQHFSFDAKPPFS